MKVPIRVCVGLGIFSLLLLPSISHAFTIAVFDFVSDEKGMETTGAKVSALLRSDLTTEQRMAIVERDEMKRMLGDIGLGKAGIVDESQAPRVGKLLGAQAIIVGRVFPVDQDVYIVAKLIGVETSRVFAQKVKVAPADSLDAKVTELAHSLAELVDGHQKDLVGKADAAKPQLEELQHKIRGNKLPKVSVAIQERHMGARAIDPAAQTELTFILEKLGFVVLESDPAVLASWADALLKDPTTTPPREMKSVEVVFVGEAFSEFAARTEGLFSCKARVEIKAIDRKTGRILGVDRQERTEVDVAEFTAAKRAIQNATEDIAHRLIPGAVKTWNKL